MEPRQESNRIDLPLLIVAVFAFLWAVARACVQSITMDEADTYLTWVARTEPFQWYPAANNHFLNSALMRVFTTVFGLSHLTVRLPALLGAAIYIGISFYASMLICRRTISRLLLFICLVYNPFVFDFLVAARGYGMANAFLVCAVVIPAAGILRKTSPIRICAACSVFVAGSFAANFSLAFVDLAMLLMVFWWICRARGFSLRLLAAAILPGAGITLVLPLSIVLRWPHGEFVEGVRSLRDSFGTVIHWSWYELNPEVASPLMFQIMRRLEHPLLWALAGIVLGRLVLLILYRREIQQDERSRWLSDLSIVLVSALVLAITVHWIAFRSSGLLLPYNRIALFYVPLFTLFVAAISAIPTESRLSRGLDYGGISVFSLIALHFVLSLRLTYFAEWKYDADVSAVYAKLAPFNHDYCVTDVGANWFYSSVLNFYRALSGRENFVPFQPGLPLQTDKQVYVLHGKFDRDFINSQKLMIVYHGDSTDVVIALRPEVLARGESDHPCP
ncbi:MAG TPA: hypothetical protein VGG72_26430 [Bryobacteraceae bacterium]|jgi:hypothetical protein